VGLKGNPWLFLLFISAHMLTKWTLLTRIPAVQKRGMTLKNKILVNEMTKQVESVALAYSTVKINDNAVSLKIFTSKEHHVLGTKAGQLF
jgi:hypothetical protein